MKNTLDIFTISYIETALWSETDDSGNALDDNFDVDDIADETLAEMIEDCQQFQTNNAALLAGLDAKNTGHDFWLTRNRHGAGFWDGDYSDAIGKALTEASHVWGEFNLYIGDNGKVYGS
jgi:hypothetical protein